MPQILLMENVPQVIGKKNIKDFAEWVAFLDTLGYTSKWAVLNAKDFNVPQNRERCYMVSWLGDHSYYFPQGEGCKQQLKDMLEKQVDEKYYLTDRLIKYFENNSKKQKEKGNGFRFEPTWGGAVAKSVTASASSRMDDNFIIAPPR